MCFSDELGMNAATAFAAATREVFFAGGADGFASGEDFFRDQNGATGESRADNARGGSGDVAELCEGRWKTISSIFGI